MDITKEKIKEAIESIYNQSHELKTFDNWYRNISDTQKEAFDKAMKAEVNKNNKDKHYWDIFTENRAKGFEDYTEASIKPKRGTNTTPKKKKREK